MKINYLLLMLFLSIAGCKKKEEKKNEQVAEVRSVVKEITQKDGIIGTWVAEGDSKFKMVFTEDNIRKDYYENTLVGTYKYYVTDTCGENTSTDGIPFLKTIELDGTSDFTCDILQAVNNENSGILSITSERGKLELYTKVP